MCLLYCHHANPTLCTCLPSPTGSLPSAPISFGPSLGDCYCANAAGELPAAIKQLVDSAFQPDQVVDIFKEAGPPHRYTQEIPAEWLDDADTYRRQLFERDHYTDDCWKG